MQKDPAFLFYSKDFYEGTRMMLPEERACYIDLLIYQHQHGGLIPDEPKRLTMYCTGCSAEVVSHVLNTKFNQTADGWVNQKLDHLVNQRSTAQPKKIASACFAGLISTRNLNKNQIKKIKKSFNIDDFIEKNGELIFNETVIKSGVREWFDEMVDQMVKPSVENLANANAIVNGNKRKGGLGEKHLTLDELRAEVKNQFTWKETVIRNLKDISPGLNSQTLELHLVKFFKVLSADGETDKTWKDFQKHFNRWLTIEVQKDRPRSVPPTKQMDHDVHEKFKKHG